MTSNYIDRKFIEVNATCIWERNSLWVFTIFLDKYQEVLDTNFILELNPYPLLSKTYHLFPTTRYVTKILSIIVVITYYDLLKFYCSLIYILKIQ